MGVFATRSTHRPNPLGLSLLKVLERFDDGLLLGGGDMLDGTPVLDIKPYLPWCESVPHACNAVAPAAPVRWAVHWSEAAVEALADWPAGQRNALRQQVDELLALDARPAYQQDSARVYVTEFERWQLRWRYVEQSVELISLARLSA